MSVKKKEIFEIELDIPIFNFKDKKELQREEAQQLYSYCNKLTRELGAQLGNYQEILKRRNMLAPKNKGEILLKILEYIKSLDSFTQQDIQQNLNISGSVTSNSINLLKDNEEIEEIGKKGKKKAYRYKKPPEQISPMGVVRSYPLGEKKIQINFEREKMESLK